MAPLFVSSILKTEHMNRKYSILLLLILICVSCVSQDKQDVDQITYEMYTRGSSTSYSISPERIQVVSTGLNASESSVQLKDEEWEALLETMKALDLGALNDLEVPSDRRASDAAPHAVLKLRKKDSVYETKSFDHGNPPQAIRPLVQAILRLAENVE